MKYKIGDELVYKKGNYLVLDRKVRKDANNVEQEFLLVEDLKNHGQFLEIGVEEVEGKSVKAKAVSTKKPVAKKASKPVAKKTTKKVVKKPAPKKAAKKPVAKKASKPVAKKASKPVAKKTAKKVVKKSSAKKASKPVAKKATKKAAPKKSPAKAAKKTTKKVVKKSPAKKSTPKKAVAKKSAPKKATSKKPAAKKATKPVAKKTTKKVVKKSVSKKVAKKPAAKKASKPVAKKTSKVTVDQTPVKQPSMNVIHEAFSKNKFKRPIIDRFVRTRPYELKAASVYYKTVNKLKMKSLVSVPDVTLTAAEKKVADQTWEAMKNWSTKEAPEQQWGNEDSKAAKKLAKQQAKEAKKQAKLAAKKQTVSTQNPDVVIIGDEDKKSFKKQSKEIDKVEAKEQKATKKEAEQVFGKPDAKADKKAAKEQKQLAKQKAKEAKAEAKKQAKEAKLAAKKDKAVKEAKTSKKQTINANGKNPDVVVFNDDDKKSFKKQSKEIDKVEKKQEKETKKEAKQAFSKGPVNDSADKIQAKEAKKENKLAAKEAKKQAKLAKKQAKQKEREAKKASKKNKNATVMKSKDTASASKKATKKVAKKPAKKVNAKGLAIAKIFLVCVFILMAAGIIVASAFMYGNGWNDSNWIPAAACEVGFGGIGFFSAIAILIIGTIDGSKNSSLYRWGIGMLAFVFATIIGGIAVSKLTGSYDAINTLEYIATVLGGFVLFDNVFELVVAAKSPSSSSLSTLKENTVITDEKVVSVNPEMDVIDNDPNIKQKLPKNGKPIVNHENGYERVKDNPAPKKSASKKVKGKDGIHKVIIDDQNNLIMEETTNKDSWYDKIENFSLKDNKNK